PAFRATVRLAQSYAHTDSTVLITGESGTGKELLAQSIHNASNRQHAPFVAINCAAFPASLLESELFGYEEGAFTGSRKGGRVGLIESAHSGTLFLDEIGDMPVSLQTRLLRVLQEREVLRLGASEPTPVDIRVIAATHCD
ncbi:MAG: sigma-54 factor interaction domain-containing protein, partial [Citrobacter sp.]